MAAAKEQNYLTTMDTRSNFIVSLKKITLEDLEHFYEWASDPEVAKTMSWEAYSSKEQAAKFLRDVVERHPWFKAICVNDVPVGSITLTPGQGAGICRAELGYVLAQKYWGQGIATDAVKLALKDGFKDLNVQRIEALVAPDNIASKKVLMKAEMMCEGLLKNYVFFKGRVCDRYLYAKVI